MRAPTCYLDAATATPLHPVARQALLAALDDGWADPGRVYPRGRRARQLVDAAAEAIADALRVRVDELHITAGGTEAAFLAVAGTRLARHRVGATVAHSAVEHSAVIKAAGSDAVPVRVDRLGRVDTVAFAEAVRAPGVALAALMSANHEVGTTQPVAEAAEACREAAVPLYVDAAQSVGRVDTPPGWSLLSASARKWGGPAGIGLLVVRKGVRWADPRSAAPPVNIPLLVAAAAGLRAAMAEARAEAARIGTLVDRIRTTVAATVPDVEVVGDPVDRLPHIVTFSCLYVSGEALLHALAAEGFDVSSGSACTADTLRPSHVLAAMGVLTHGNVRLSPHRGTTEQEIDTFLSLLPRTVHRLRVEAGVAT